MSHFVPLAISVFPAVWQWATLHTMKSAILGVVGFFGGLIVNYGRFWLRNTHRKGFFATFKGELLALEDVLETIDRLRSRKTRADAESPAPPFECTPAATEDREKAHRARNPQEPDRATQEGPPRQRRNAR